jgi:hypothetical protein
MNPHISGDIQVQVEKHKACLRCFERLPAYDVHFTWFVRQGWPPELEVDWGEKNDV